MRASLLLTCTYHRRSILICFIALFIKFAFFWSLYRPHLKLQDLEYGWKGLKALPVPFIVLYLINRTNVHLEYGFRAAPLATAMNPCYELFQIHSLVHGVRFCYLSIQPALLFLFAFLLLFAGISAPFLFNFLPYLFPS